MYYMYVLLLYIHRKKIICHTVNIDYFKVMKLKEKKKTIFLYA